MYLRNKEQAVGGDTHSGYSTATASVDDSEGDMSLELTAIPYTMTLELECDTFCHGSIVRLPDGVEASFNHTEGLLILLESMGGRRWWQENQSQIEARVMSLIETRTLN